MDNTTEKRKNKHENSVSKPTPTNQPTNQPTPTTTSLISVKSRTSCQVVVRSKGIGAANSQQGCENGQQQRTNHLLSTLFYVLYNKQPFPQHRHKYIQSYLHTYIRYNLLTTLSTHNIYIHYHQLTYSTPTYVYAYLPNTPISCVSSQNITIFRIPDLRTYFSKIILFTYQIHEV